MLQAIVGLIGKVVRTITLKRVLTWAAAGFISIAGFTIYENRTVVFAGAFQDSSINPTGLVFTIGQETRERTIEIVSRYDDVVAVSIMSADIRLNEARSVFFYSSSVSFTQAFEASQKRGNDVVPIFTNLEENNAEMVKAINGEFSCLAFEKTLSARIYPEMKTEVAQVCRASIPSYYGHFSGYVTIFLKTPDSIGAGLRLSLRQSLEKLATDIYFRDVLTTQRRVGEPPKLLK